MAVGTDPTAPSETFGAAWDGAAWSPVVMPGGAVRGPAGYGGVSCRMVTACTAVGVGFFTRQATAAIAAGWNGTRWTSEPTPHIAGSDLSGVSCPGASACVAVGLVAIDDGQSELPLVERYSG
jgi:hypothetical protein